MSLKKTPVAGPLTPTTMPLNGPSSSYAAIPSSNRGASVAQTTQVATKVAVPASKPLPTPPAAAKPAANAPSPNEKIIALVRAGNLVEVQKLLAANPQLVSVKDKAGRDLRLIAGINGHVSLLEFFNEMQKKQPGLFADKRDGSHIINEMISFGDVALAAVQWFLAQGVTPNTKITQYALNDAANMGGEQTLAFLRTKITTNDLKIPAQVKKLQPFAKELFEAAEGGDIPMMEYYCQQGANIKLATYGPGSALPVTTAAACGQVDAVQWFLKTKGVEPTVKNSRNYNLMYVAAQHGYVGMMRVCKEYSIDPLKDVNGDENALSAAILNGQNDAIEFIIKEYNPKGIDIILRIGGLNLLNALSDGHTQSVKLAIARLEPEQLASASKYILFNAASDGNVPVLRLCKQIFPKLDLSMRDEKKESALSRAALGLHLEAVKCLILELGVDIGKSIPKEVVTALQAKRPESQPVIDFIFAEWEKQRRVAKVAVVTPQSQNNVAAAPLQSSDSSYKSPLGARQGVSASVSPASTPTPPPLNPSTVRV